MQRAGEFISNPHSAYAGNVFDDMIRLIGKARRETGQWKRVGEIAQMAEENIEANIAGWAA